MPSVIIKTREELLAWRADVLARVHMDRDKLYELGMDFQLRPDERSAFEMVRMIDYLLDED